ncbi:ABC transporter ATP-binding protein [Rhizomonospora bruguierae]|uniref:ABC transporter ATP-binding protein n=1 Tax=Rhizomonospora bruguierae TaxID=1581705 RepID=UPI001BCF701D|nr:ATP-binding cassette domain-containing protein [Micromonospora sp. NBRC 107566]
MIQALGLTKRYGRVPAVNGVSFTARPGRVTGFLGLNGSGKTTTLRMLLGLVRPTAGEARINNRRLRDLKHPVREVGAVLEQGISHPGQSGRAHLVSQAILAGVGGSRVDALLDHVGLTHAAEKRSGDYSLGMRQRLAVATALLGDPPTLVLDEPANGLDPEGVAWLRGLLRDHADRGGTVLISSHLLAELAQLIDDVVIIVTGLVTCEAPLTSLYGAAAGRLRVRSRDQRRLWQVFESAGGRVTRNGDALEVVGLTAEHAGEIAFHARVPLHELAVEAPDLEQIFLNLAGS